MSGTCPLHNEKHGAVIEVNGYFGGNHFAAEIPLCAYCVLALRLLLQVSLNLETIKSLLKDPDLFGKKMDEAEQAEP